MTIRSRSDACLQNWFLHFASFFALSLFANAQAPKRMECDAAELLPKSILACAHVAHVGEALQTILHHPLRTKLESLQAFTEFMRSPQAKQLQFGVAAFEASMELPWQQAIAKVCDQGVTIAFDSSDGGVAALVHSTDEEVLERFRGFLVAARLLQGGSAKQGDYRGFKADSLSDHLKMVRMNDWLLLTNKSELGKLIVDRYLDRGNESFATNEKYTTVSREVNSNETKRLVTAFVDVEKLRNAETPNKIYNERVDNFFVELAVGGILANLRHAPYAAATIDLDQSGLSLQVSTPHKRDWESPREYFFGSPELSVAPSLLNVSDQLFAISIHRDLCQMWLRCGDLLTVNANEQLAVADTQLTTFFSGRDFGEDILGSIESDIQIVGKIPSFDNALPKPTIKLPAVAVEFQMKHPGETQSELRRVFQSLVGFINITGAMNGQPQLDLGLEYEGDAQMVTSTYVPKRDQRQSNDAPIQFNFTPTLAFSGKRVVLSSSTQLARELLSITSEPSGREFESSNTVAMVDAPSLQQLLHANRPQLVANNMLEKGHSKESAEREIALFHDLIGFLNDARISLNVKETRLSVTVHVDFMNPKMTRHER